MDTARSKLDSSHSARPIYEQGTAGISGPHVSCAQLLYAMRARTCRSVSSKRKLGLSSHNTQNLFKHDALDRDALSPRRPTWNCNCNGNWDWDLDLDLDLDWDWDRDWSQWKLGRISKKSNITSSHSSKHGVSFALSPFFAHVWLCQGRAVSVVTSQGHRDLRACQYGAVVSERVVTGR